MRKHEVIVAQPPCSNLNVIYPNQGEALIKCIGVGKRPNMNALLKIYDRGMGTQEHK